MRIGAEYERNDTNLDTQAVGFKIKQSPHAFMVLSKNMYSAPIRAVIREVLCNAVDSHTEAGVPITQINVHIPTVDKPTFSVTDNGTGLSFDKVEQLYSTYFDSTKMDSNDAIGGFGIGSKSPFAYTDRFTINARWNGRARNYVCYISDGSDDVEAGAPTLRQIGDEYDTTEPNGLSVEMAVKRMDVPTFITEYKDIAMWFTDKPTSNVEVDDIPEPVIQERYYRIFKYGAISINKYQMQRMYIEQGNVIYPINTQDFKLNEAVLSDLGSNVLVFNVPIGTVSPAPSREQLTYDAKTVANINSLLMRFTKDVTEGYCRVIAEAPTKWEAYKKRHEILSLPGARAAKIQYNGEDIGGYITINKVNTPIDASLVRYTFYSTNSDATISKRAREQTTIDRVSGDAVYNISPHVNDYVMWFPHMRSRQVAKMRRYFDAKGQISANVLCIFCDKKELPNVKSLLGDPEIITDFPDIPKAARQANIVKPYRVRGGGLFGQSDLGKVDIDFDKGGLYARTKFFTVEDRDLIGNAIQAGVITKDEFYVVPKSMHERFDNDPKWKYIVPVIKSRLDKGKAWNYAKVEALNSALASFRRSSRPYLSYEYSPEYTACLLYENRNSLSWVEAVKEVTKHIEEATDKLAAAERKPRYVDAYKAAFPDWKAPSGEEILPQSLIDKIEEHKGFYKFVLDRTHNMCDITKRMISLYVEDEKKKGIIL